MAGCKSGGGIEVRHLKLRGVSQIPDDDLRAVLATQPSSRLPWGGKNYFDRARFEEDLKRIQAFYADRGFPDARVTGFDVALDKPQNRVDITINVSEGQPAIASGVTFEGFQALTEQRRKALEAQAALQKGGRLDRSAINTTREAALNALRDNGYPYAKVAISQQATGDPKKVDVTFTATPGVEAYFGPIEIAGNKSVGDGIIRRELRYKPGDLYRRNLVLRSQRKLYDLELFQFANIQNLNAEQQPAEVPTRVTVAEGKHQRLQFSGGYGTEEKLRAEGQWRNLNFLGGARQFGVHGKWSSLDRGLRAEFTQPYFLGSDLSFGVEGHRWYDNEPAYSERLSGARATVTHQISPRNMWSLSYTDDFDSSTASRAALNDPGLRPELIALGLNPITGVQSGTLTSLSLSAVRSTAANPLDAVRGYYLTTHLEQAGHWLGGTFAFSALSGEGRIYLPVTRTMVMALRASYGTIRPSGGDPAEVPFAKRLYLGGADSLRGWGRYEVSPLVDGLPTGGFTLLVASAELRTHITGKFGTVAFLDLGNVWTTSWRVHPDDLRYDIGPGLRYDTPIGPVRLDFGYQLNPIPGLLVNGSPQTRRWRVHFSIGQAF